MRSRPILAALAVALVVPAFWADTRTGESEGWTARIDPSAV